ncbi:MAG: DoxX family protein [Anaerolineales bacterium]|nr:DoxX family protein [Anaerolineales bacterium]
MTLAFLGAGYLHLFGPGKGELPPQAAWIKAVPKPLMAFIGVAEFAGALGLLLPMLTGILPWLTPLAAALLALVMLLAVLFHLPRKEYQSIGLNLFLLLLAAFVAWGRWSLFG